MGSRDHSGEMQLAPIGVSEVSTILRDLQCEFIRTTALLLFCSSKQTGADELLDHVVTSCHGTFAGATSCHGTSSEDIERQPHPGKCGIWTVPGRIGFFFDFYPVWVSAPPSYS